MSFLKKVVFINFILIFWSGLLLSGFIRLGWDFYVEDKYADALLVENSYIADLLVFEDFLFLEDDKLTIDSSLKKYKEIANHTKLPSSFIVINKNGKLLSSYPSNFDSSLTKELLLDIVIKEQGRRYEFQIDEISHFTVNTEIKKVLNDEETELIVVSFFPIYELENLINIIFKPIFSALIIFDIGQFIAFFN